ncbi:MAG TPA: DUF4139 domain-containing protein [Anaerolineae bacterium]|nr:DUF4139 domain-containing protein [Anaerolineae bacterium]
MKRTALFAALAALLMIVSVSLPSASNALLAAQAEEKTVQLTVYNQDLALVSETRAVALESGLNEVVYSDVAAQIDPTSVSFRSLTDPDGTAVLEQNFEYDLVGSTKLLQKYIDQVITVQTQDSQTYTGTLLSAVDSVILQGDDGAVTMLSQEQIRNIDFPALPEGLRTRPSLVWLVDAEQAGEHDTAVTYLTNGIGWQADYVFLLNEDSTAFDLNGWVTLDNRSGASYEDAMLKLVAGDINKVEEPQYARDVMMMAEAAAAPPAVEQREFFEYHLYQVTRPVTVKDNQTKQIEFVTAQDVPVTKFYVYDGAAGYSGYGYGPVEDSGYGAQTGNTNVTVMLEFRTDEASNLETQLPAGRVRLYQEDVDGSALLVGEDQIDHTPKNETVRLTVGNAFDIKGERIQTSYKPLGDSGAQESFKITLRNHKDEPVEVRVVENLYRWTEWTMLSETLDGKPVEHNQLSSQQVEWLVPVPANGEAVLEYEVQYRWK